MDSRKRKYDENVTVTSACSLPADRLVVAQSKTSNRGRVLIWSCSKKQWTTFPCPVSPRGSSAVLHGDHLIVTGGKTMHSFDLRSHQWSRGPDLLQERSCHGMAVVRDEVFVVAGFYSHTDTYLTSIEEYSQASGQWTHAGDLQVATEDCGVTALGDTILVVGGDMRESVQEVQTFNVRTRTAAVLDVKLPRPMYHVQAARLGASAFFVGSTGDMVQIRDVKGTFEVVSNVQLKDFGARLIFGVQVTDNCVRVTDSEKKTLRTAVWNRKGEKMEEGDIAELSEEVEWVHAVLVGDILVI